MVWIHAINESAAETFCDGVLNPMSPDKFRTLGRRLGLRPGQRVLDVGAGRCGLAIVLTSEFGCDVTAVEPYEVFLDAAHRRVEELGLTDRFEFVRSTGADHAIAPARYDVAMCIGAEWAWGGLEGTLHALTPGVRDGGHVVVGTVYHVEGQNWTDTAPEISLEEVLDLFERTGLRVVTLIRSTIDDFDTYASVHAASLLDWLEANPGHPDAEQVEMWRRGAVGEFVAKPFGWALVAGRKTDASP